MSALRGHCARIALMTTATSFAFNSVAAAETLSLAGNDDPFASLETLSVDELMDARGGYSAGGLKFSIGVTVTPVTVTPVKPLPAGGALGGKGALPEGGALGGKGALPEGGALGGKGALPEGGALGGNGALPEGGALGGQGALPNGAFGNEAKSEAASSNAVSSEVTSAPSALETSSSVEPPSPPTVTESAGASSAPTVVVETPPAAAPQTPIISTESSSQPEPPNTSPPVVVDLRDSIGAPLTPVAAAETAQDAEPAPAATFSSSLNLDVQDYVNQRHRGDSSNGVANLRTPGGTGGASKQIEPGDSPETLGPGSTVITQNGHSIQVDNSRDNVTVSFTTDYTVRFENYRQGIEALTAARITQMAIGSHTILGGLSN